MKLIIDSRETKLYEECLKLKQTIDNYKKINIESKSLDLGDIIIKDDDDNEKLIIERKTVSDLISSISDGRYNEQSFRLNGIEHENHNIIYLIEGTLKNLTSQKQMVYSSIFSINYYKGFSVHRSDNVSESAYILMNMTYKIEKEKEKISYYPKGEREEKDYVSVIKKKKNENISKDNFMNIVLCQVPSINEVTANVISKQFLDIYNLINSLKENENCLDSLTYTTSKNQVRKINKTCIKNIKEFFL
jgi:ERCC4-type nuclease